MTNQKGGRGFAKEVGKAVAQEAKTSLRWAFVGAVVGSVAVGIAGAFYFGVVGLVAGAVVGALVGGIGAWWAFIEGSTLT